MANIKKSVRKNGGDMLRKTAESVFCDTYEAVNIKESEDYENKPNQGVIFGGMKMYFDRKKVERLRAQYPAGTRVELDSMNDPSAILPGTQGTIAGVDDIGNILMKWDNGRSLSLVPGEDSFHIITQELSTFKLYMPLVLDLYECNEYGDMEDANTILDGRAACAYEDKIREAIIKERLPEEQERGIMHWYHERDSLNEKIRSAVFSVEEQYSALWGTVECKSTGELTVSELRRLENFVEGQASDGWGEGFEQRAISVDGGEIYVHLWSDDSSWCIRTENEMTEDAPKFGGNNQCQTM